VPEPFREQVLVVDSWFVIQLISQMKAQMLNQFKLMQGTLPALSDEDKRRINADFETLPALMRDNITKQLSAAPEDKKIHVRIDVCFRTNDFVCRCKRT